MGLIQGSGTKIDLISPLQPSAQTKSPVPVDPLTASAPLFDTQKLFWVGMTMLKSTPGGLALSVASRLFSNPKPTEKAEGVEVQAQKDLQQVEGLMAKKKYTEAKQALDATTKKYFTSGLIGKTHSSYAQLLGQASLLSVTLYAQLKNPNQSLKVLQKAEIFLSEQSKKAPKDAQLFQLLALARTMLASQESDPTKKLFFAASFDLMSGRHVEAQLKLRAFKQQTESSQDPQIVKMRAEAGSILRCYALVSVAKLSHLNQSLPEPLRSQNTQLLAGLKQVLEAGKADTVDAALALVPQGLPYLGEAFWKNPVVPSGAWVELNNPKVAAITINGGTLQVPASGYPAHFKLSFGTKGGYLHSADGKTYHIMPSAKGHEIWLQKGVLDVSQLKVGQDYLENTGWGTSSKTPNSPISAVMKVLLEMETQSGLEKSQGPQGAEYHFAKAKELRGLKAYSVAGEILEPLFQSEMRRAIGAISQDEMSRIQFIGEKKRAKAESQVKEILAKQKKESPEQFQKTYPKGWPNDAECNALVQITLHRGMEMEIRQTALQKIAGWNAQGWAFEKTPLAKRAWELYEDMLDPLHRVTKFSDETWDQLPELVLREALIAGVTMGVGVAVQAGMKGSAVFRTVLGAAGEGSVTAGLLEGGVLLARMGAESAVLTLLSDDASLKTFGANLLTLSVFHRGQQAWQFAAKGMGIDGVSLATAKAAGEGVLGKQILSHAGAVATPGAVAVGLDVALDHEVNGETAALHFLKMGAFHGLGSLLAAPHAPKAKPLASKPKFIEVPVDSESTIPESDWVFARKGNATQPWIFDEVAAKKVGNFTPSENETSGVWEISKGEKKSSVFAKFPVEKGTVQPSELPQGLYEGGLIDSAGNEAYPLAFYKKANDPYLYAHNSSLMKHGFLLWFRKDASGAVEMKYDGQLLPKDRYTVSLESSDGQAQAIDSSEIETRFQNWQPLAPNQKIKVVFANGTQKTLQFLPCQALPDPIEVDAISEKKNLVDFLAKDLVPRKNFKADTDTISEPSKTWPHLQSWEFEATQQGEDGYEGWANYASKAKSPHETPTLEFESMMHYLAEQSWNENTTPYPLDISMKVYLGSIWLGKTN